jgi:hypothetical protein
MWILTHNCPHLYAEICYRIPAEFLQEFGNLKVYLFFRPVTIFSAVDVCANDKNMSTKCQLVACCIQTYMCFVITVTSLYIVIDHKINFPSLVLATFYFE